ncbi:MAG: VCBS repeat-containing protein [Rickettsiales bacterium]
MIRRSLLAAALCVWAAAAPAAEWQAAGLGKVDGLSRLSVDASSGALYAHGAEGRFVLAGRRFVASPADSAAAAAAPSDIIPHGRVAVGANHIARAWLVQPTRRYDHGVLGDEIEAAALKVELRDGREMVYELGDQYVFEDLLPRLADMDGDGLDEVFLARSSLTEGAAVSIYKVGPRRLEQFSVTPSIGLPYRWLNPLGAADFDADGEMDIAVVETPHLGKTLVVYGRQAARLRELGRLRGFSTHAAGSTVLEMAVVLDLNDDGVMDMVLPNETRGALVGVTFRGGAFAVLASGPKAAPIVTEVVSVNVDGQGLPDIVYGRADGTIEAILR